MTADDLWKKLTSAADDLIKLEIVTAVGPLKYEASPDGASGKGRYVPDGAQPTKVMHTRIDLLQGDVVTQMDEEFATGKYQSLRDYHASREKQGNEIISANIKTLKSLFELLTQIKK